MPLTAALWRKRRKRGATKASGDEANRPSRRRRFRPLLVEAMEPRILLATRVWTGGGANDLWSNASNWDTGVPASGDDVVIADVGAASAEVLFDSTVPGTGVTLNSLVSGEPFHITADTLTLDGAGTFAFNAGLTIDAGTIAGTDDFSVGGAALAWNAGTIGGSGVVNVSGGLTIATTSTKFLDGRTLNLNSNTIWSAGQWSLQNGAVINNLAGRTFEIRGDFTLDDSTGFNSVFNNFGVLVKSAGTGTATIQTQFNVNGSGSGEGLVDIQVGTLRLTSEGTANDGTFTEASI